MQDNDYLINYYNEYDEEGRLQYNRVGMVEYLTTRRYLDSLLTKDCKIAEIGAGTGRYSVTLAKEGYDVTAVELVPHKYQDLSGQRARFGYVRGQCLRRYASARPDVSSVFRRGKDHRAKRSGQDHKAGRSYFGRLLHERGDGDPVCFRLQQAQRDHGFTYADRRLEVYQRAEGFV